MARRKTKESVWDYPRPPRVEASSERVRVEQGGRVIIESTRTYRVLETSHPPTYYFPPADMPEDLLRPASGVTYCEWKGRAEYFDLELDGERLEGAIWRYPEPTEQFRMLKGYYSLYPGRFDACLIDGEQVQAQEGSFYGGWITSNIVGPFKGAPGTFGW